MPRYRSRSRTPSPSRRKRYDDPRDSRRERRSPAPSGLLVRNISLSARPDDLRIPFERFGPIKDIYLPKNYYTGEPRGFGFVKFRYPEDAAEAKRHLDCTVIGGREIRIVFAEENRKSPHEMRRVTRESSRGSYRRRSRSSSPRRRYRSHSRSPSPARHASRDGRREARDDRYSPHRSRSVSISVSPQDDRNYMPHERSRRHSRSQSRSVSPSDGKNHKKSRQSPNNRENGQARHVDAPIRSLSPRRSSRSPVRSRSRSHRFSSLKVHFYFRCHLPGVVIFAYFLGWLQHGAAKFCSTRDNLVTFVNG
ncbi:hypothetical protein CASFOL_029711 [Castilleja foliolosa]|uniref:RRM domain-containing protein n=1 Tax=Castilleja foliolosa TaxID=1961234 RepID=A0ABD3CBT1_9LAMI